MKHPRSLHGHQAFNASRCVDVWRDSGHILDTPTHCPGRQGPCVCVRACWWGRYWGCVHQCSAASSGGIYAPAERICAGQAAVLRVIPKEKKKNPHLCARMRPNWAVTFSRVVTSRSVFSVYGSALQDRVLSAGGKQDRLGGSGEVPGPEADRNWSLWDRLVRPKPAVLFFCLFVFISWSNNIEDMLKCTLCAFFETAAALQNLFSDFWFIY